MSINLTQLHIVIDLFGRGNFTQRTFSSVIMQPCNSTFWCNLYYSHMQGEMPCRQGSAVPCNKSCHSQHVKWYNFGLTTDPLQSEIVHDLFDKGHYSQRPFNGHSQSHVSSFC
jgi:hypothetical protein